MKRWCRLIVGTVFCAAAVASTARSAPERAAGDSVRFVISGARRFSADRVRSWVRGSGGIERVAREYAAAGYWSAVVGDATERTEDGLVRSITISEGPRSFVADDDLLGASGDPADVPEEIVAVLRSQAESGHPFASIELIAARESDAGRFALETVLNPGPEVVIGRIRPVGNAVTRAEVIVRELRVPAGGTYDHRAVLRWKRRLERTGYFESVAEPVLVWRDLTAGVADLAVVLEEGRPNRFEGVVGYQPGEAGRKGQFTGLADLTLGNIRGTGRLLHVRWNRPQSATTTLDLEYREPWIAGFPTDAEARLAVEQRRGYALERIELALGGEVVPDLTADVAVGREIVRSDSVLLLGGPRYRGYVLRAGVEYDTRDVPLNPMRGLCYRFDWKYDLRRNRVFDEDFVRWFGSGLWPERERTTTVRLDVEHYLPFGQRFVLAVGWHGAQVTSTRDSTAFSESEQIRLGGALTVRGYRQDQFLGDRVVWGNHEWRYRIGPSSRLFAFLDAGAVRSRRYNPTTQGTVSVTAWPVGYGFGLRARTLAGQVGVDFGWGRGDGFGQGKVHVRLETTF